MDERHTDAWGGLHLTNDSAQMQNTVVILGSLTKLTSLELSNLKFDWFRQVHYIMAACYCGHYHAESLTPRPAQCRAHGITMPAIETIENI